MRIYCDSLAVFETPDHRELERLLMRVRLGQHSLILDDLDGFYSSSFFSQAVASASRVEVRELLDRQVPALADRGADPAARAPGPRAELVPVALSARACRREGAHPVWEIDPSTAGDWSEGSLRILLENDKDWFLVEAAARVYERPTVVDAANRMPRFLVLDQRGGKDEVKKAVMACRPYERVFVLMDSDRVDVGGPEGKTQQDIRVLVETRSNVRLFIVAKREVENYLPAVVWRDAVPDRMTRKPAIRERIRKRRAWEKLSDAEKDIVDLEAYFPDAKQHVRKICDSSVVPDAATLEARAGRELVSLLNELEAWL